MPLYEYRCRLDGEESHVFEVLQRFGAREAVCPDHGIPSSERVVSQVAPAVGSKRAKWEADTLHRFRNARSDNVGERLRSLADRASNL